VISKVNFNNFFRSAESNEHELVVLVVGQTPSTGILQNNSLLRRARKSVAHTARVASNSIYPPRIRVTPVPPFGRPCCVTHFVHHRFSFFRRKAPYPIYSR
jgi:hypothetical protein